MRKILLLGALAALLGGCTNIVDTDAVPAADARQKLALAECKAQVGKTINTVSQYVECELAAEHDMAIAVKLRDMSLYDAYAARMRLTARQADAKEITPEQVTDQFAQAAADLDNQVRGIYASDQRKRAQMAAALSGMAEAAQRQADRDAYIQAHNPTVNCTSTPFGRSVTTTCN